MKVLAIYDTTGKIWNVVYGAEQAPEGMPSMWVDIPDFAQLLSIDVSTEPHQPVFGYLPDYAVGQIRAAQTALQADIATVRQEAEAASQTAEAVSVSNRTAILAASFSAVAFTDEQAVQVPELYAEWNAAGVSYSAGDRVRYGGGLYKCLSAHTSQESWTPAAAPSLWVAIGAPDAGTKENPITWKTGMEAESGKYYKDTDGVLWRCIESSGVGLYGEPKDLARYFERVE